MFAIAVPQTVQLVETPWVDPALPPPPPDKPVEAPPVAGSVTFDHATEDVSTCRMTVTIGDKVFTHVFGVNGSNPIANTYEDDGIRKAKETAAKKAGALAAEQRKKDQEAAKAQAAKELSTADDTTVADLSTDAHPQGEVDPFGHVVAPGHPHQPPFDPQTGQPNPLYHPEAG
jgi:hypothetical protein